MGANIRDNTSKASRINFHGFKFHDCGTGRVANRNSYVNMYIVHTCTLCEISEKEKVE